MSAAADQPTGLIQLLLDQTAEFGDRDDAAMDLGAFNENGAEEALAQVACDDAADEDLADSCGESLAEIWCRKGRVTEDVLVRLAPVSLRIAMARMEAQCPALAESAKEVLRAHE